MTKALMSEALTNATLQLAQDWCAIPSIAGDDEAITRQAALIVDWLVDHIGAEIIFHGPVDASAPLIHARIDCGASETVILYNMYDVMPATPEGWSVDPFGGEVIELDPFGKVFVARGAENNKGPLAGMLCVLEDMLSRDSLKVNVELLIEGEEENGSGGLRRYLSAPNCPVRRSVSGLFPSLCEYGGGPARVYLGFSGIAKGQIRISGGEWGGPSKPIHSSNAPWISNPVRRLVAALNLCGSEPTGQLAQIELDAEARAIIATLAKEFDPEAELVFRNTRAYAIDGSNTEKLSHVLSTASFNITSLASDPVGSSGVIPNAATAGFDLRCPPRLEPTDFCSALKAQFAERGLDGVEMDIYDAYPGCSFSADSVGVRALLAAYKESTSKLPQVWPWAIGSAPGYAFALHADSFLIGGAGRGGNAHGIDEFMTIEGLGRFLTSVEQWLLAVPKHARVKSEASS